MSVTIYDCGAVANTVSAILDNETGIMRIIGSGAMGDYSSGYSPWYSDREDINGVTIADGITRIGTGTFYNCSNISYVDIPKSVTTIGTDTFNGCTNLKSIKISNKITTLGDDTFKDSGLETVKFYGSAPSYGTDVFDGVICDIYVPQDDESWDNTVKAGLGTNDTTWYTFDAKPVLIEYDELDYFWNKIKNYVDNNVSVTQVVTSGTKIATIRVNGVDTDLYTYGLSGTVGDSTTPVYLNDGVITACGSSLAVDITGNAATATTAAACSGNAATATKATQDGSGNTITSTYATIAKTYDDTTNTSYRGMRGLDGSTSGWVRTTSSGIIPSQSGAAGSGHCGLGTSSWYFATAYVDNIYGKLNGNCTGSSASCTGNAATATTATNTNNAKLTHTVGNSEYPLVFGSSFVITDAQQALRIGTPTATAANCALRCKAYCAAANTQGEAYIVCGNNLAKASANNARGSIFLYGTSTGYSQIVPGNNSASNITLTLPSATGTIALTSSDITGSSASCTGNAATATTASACSGNAASATYATNIRVTDTDSNTWYPLVFSTGSAASTNYAARVDADSILVYPGTAPAANTQGYCYMQLGNGKAKATAGNKRGVLRIYGTGTSYTEITSAVASTARSISFPDKAGTVALTSDIPTGITSATSKTTTTYRCDELKFGSGLLLKFIYPKNNSVSLTPSADETITFGTAFTTVAAVLDYNFSINGAKYLMSGSSTNTTRFFGYFNYASQEGYGSTGQGGNLTLTSYKVPHNNPTPLTIIAGY